MAEIDIVRDEFEPVKGPDLAQTQQEVANLAFKSAVSPLRESFDERLKQASESQAARGISFGGVGGEGFRDVLKEQQRVEGQIAGSLGAQLGKSALDQAFAASEAAKSRTLQKQLQQSGFEFQKEGAKTQRAFAGEQARLGREFSGAESAQERDLRRELTQLGFKEAETGRAFQAEQAGLGRELAREQSGLGRELTREQAEAQRSLTREQAGLGRELTREQSGLGRQFAAEQAGLQRGFTADQAETSRQFAATQESLGREFSKEEADRARLFSAEQQALGRDFGTTQADLTRQFQAEEAALGRTFTKDETQRQRDAQLTAQEAAREFAAEESSLGRSFTSLEAQRQRDFGLTTQEAANDFSREQALFNRTFTSEEANKQRQFQEKFLEKELAFKVDQADVNRQLQKNDAAIRLALAGNLTGEGVDKVLEETFGKGVALTSEDEKDLQRVAAASGLSTEDYTKMRKAIGEGQLKDILKNPDDYISSPEAVRNFNLKMAEMESKAKVDVAREQSSGKVICTELYRQGLIPNIIYKADSEYAKYISPLVVNGYHYWGIPLASKMRESKLITNIVKPFGRAWAYHMAYKMGVIEERNLFGNCLEIIGIPICYLIGKVSSERSLTHG